MDKQLIQDQVVGLKAKIKEHRANKDLFIKAQGLQEQEEKLRAEAKKHRDDAAFLKNSNKKLQEKKNQIVSSSTKPLAEKITSLLPEGKGVVEVGEDGSFLLAWHNGKVVVPYHGLSGGEKATFDAALAAALKANVVICEFAELDKKRLGIALEKINGGVQTIVLSCHRPESIPKDWTVIEL